MAPDQKYIRYSTLYPDRFNVMNCFLLDWGADGFYFGCHDETFELTGHVFELEKNTSLNMTMVRYPFLKPGAGWQENKIRTAPYCGGWMTGAKNIARGADTWFRPPVIPEEIACSSGWQRIILHHQYGEYFFPYDKLEQAYDEAAKAGIHTLFLFGWTAEGMDSGYPVYTPDPSQGGFEKLKETIRKIQAKGGKIILYFNGQLIDAASEYYRSGEGQKVSIKRLDGTEHREFYNFSNTGTFLRAYGNKTFVVACPSCRSWLEILKRHVDFAIDLGSTASFSTSSVSPPRPAAIRRTAIPFPSLGLCAASARCSGSSMNMQNPASRGWVSALNASAS